MVLEAHKLTKIYRRGGLFAGKGAEFRAVDEVSFSLSEGETLAIVGESGSGKSTTARLAMRLIEADGGSVHLLGEEISHLRGEALRRRRRHIQMVFQDPFASLNPRMRIAETVGEGLRVHAPELNAAQRRQKVAEILAQCGMGEEALDRYPHQFSGGQRQRIGIARALAVAPKVVVLDEPVSALDVSVQAQILNLLRSLQREKRLSYLFISHDLSVVRQMADRVAVMFAGRIVEQGSAEALYAAPRHPYTASLLAARPIDHPSERRPVEEAAREIEAVATSGCPFRPRCPRAGQGCDSYQPHLSNEAHAVACLHPL